MGSMTSHRYDWETDCDCDDCMDGHTRSPAIAERQRRETYEEIDPDEYALVPAKKGGVRSYEDSGRKAIMSSQDAQEREMSLLKVEEQKIKNKIAVERLAFDVQKRQQAKELHDIKMVLLKKYPNVVFNKPATE